MACWQWSQDPTVILEDKLLIVLVILYNSLLLQYGCWLLIKTLVFSNVYGKGKIHFFKIVLVFMNFFKNDVFKLWVLGKNLFKTYFIKKMTYLVSYFNFLQSPQLFWPNHYRVSESPSFKLWTFCSSSAQIVVFI